MGYCRGLSRQGDDGFVADVYMLNHVHGTFAMLDAEIGIRLAQVLRRTCSCRILTRCGFCHQAGSVQAFGCHKNRNPISIPD